MASVESKIKNNITADFVQAKLETGTASREGDKGFVIEMVTNAYVAHRMITNMAMSYKLRKISFDEMKKKKLIPERMVTDEWYNEQVYKEILLRADAIFDMIITRVYMIVLVNRNVKLNYLLKLLGTGATEVATPEETEGQTIGQKVLTNIKGKPKQQNEE